MAIKEVSGVMKASGRTLMLKNNDSIDDVDAIILCTGYEVDMPFLDEGSGIRVTKKSVVPLLDEFINANYPTMSFNGLNRQPFSYLEVRFCLIY